MSKKRYKVKILFHLDISPFRAHEIIGIFLKKFSAPLSYKKHGTIDAEKIRQWRRGVDFKLLYPGYSKACRATFSFLEEQDATSFEEYINDYLDKHRKLHDEVILIE